MFNPQNPEILELSRQRRMADLLTAQGMQTPQAQNVSGIYVPPNPMEYLAKLYSTYQGTQANKDLDARETALAQKLRQLGATETQDILGIAQGTPEKITELAGPAYQGVAPTAVMPPVAGNPQAAMARAIMAQSPQAQRLVEPLMKMAMPEPTPEQKRFNAAVADGSWNVQKQGGLNSFLNQMSDKDKASLAIDKQRLALDNARLNIQQQQFAFDTGMSAGGVPAVMPTGNVPAGMPIGAPITANAMPNLIGANPAINMAGLTPKQIQALRGEAAEDFRKNFKNAQEALPVIKEAELLLPKSSSGGVQAGFTYLTKQAGLSTEMSKADAQLKILGSKLTAQVPRFEGPQSNVDVQAYREAAGAIADSTVPYADRMAALNTVKQLQSKYAPDLYAKEFSDIRTLGTPTTPTTPTTLSPTGKSTPAPAGVAQNVWNAMTPQEKALFK